MIPTLTILRGGQQGAIPLHLKTDKMTTEKPKILAQAEATLKMTTEIYIEADRAQTRAEIQVRLLNRLHELTEHIDNSVESWNLEIFRGVPSLRIEMLPDHDRSHLASEIEDLKLACEYTHGNQSIYLFQLWRMAHVDPISGAPRNTGWLLSDEKSPYLHLLFDDADEGLEHGEECELI